VVHELHLEGNRGKIRAAVVEAALEFIDAALMADDGQ